jgi:hypothetical protein
MNGDGIGRSRPPRGAFVALAALLLGLTGVTWLAYSGIAPLLPPLLEHPNPPVAMAIGVVFLAAALGVYGLRRWARWLGIALGVGVLAQTAITGPWAVGRAGADPPWGVLVSVLLPVTVAVLILVGLVFRWPERGDASTPTAD